MKEDNKTEEKDQDYYIRRDRRRDLMVLPLCAVCVAVYIAAMYFMLGDQNSGLQIRVMQK